MNTHGNLTWGSDDNEQRQPPVPETPPNEWQTLKSESNRIYDDLPTVDKLKVLANKTSGVVALRIFPDGSGSINVEFPFSSMTELEESVDNVVKLS